MVIDTDVVLLLLLCWQLDTSVYWRWECLDRTNWDGKVLIHYYCPFAVCNIRFPQCFNGFNWPPAFPRNKNRSHHSQLNLWSTQKFEANAYCIWNVSTFSSNFDRKTIAGMSAINRSIHVPPRLPLFGANILSSIAISENIQSNTHTLHTRG